MAFFGNCKTVEEIFKDFSGRRDALVRALTSDLSKVDSLCDQDKSKNEDEDLCLYGHPTGMWEVRHPSDGQPLDLPVPVSGINFRRSRWGLNAWMYLLAKHSDSWLLSVAFFLGAKLNRNDRERLFTMINELPTVLEVVTKEFSGDQEFWGDNFDTDLDNNDGGNKSKENDDISIDDLDIDNGGIKSMENNDFLNEDLDIDDGGNKFRGNTETKTNYVGKEDEHSETLCKHCGGNYIIDEFWVSCDICMKWFHGECAGITTSMAEYFRKYECANCIEASRKIW